MKPRATKPALWKAAILNTAALVSVGFWIGAAVATRRSARAVPSLDDVREASDEECPTLSVVAPACNEAATIEPALQSLLALDYPKLEIIAVNDRSTDDTGPILRRMASVHPSLKVVDITTLPAGWLGKNHALATGAGLAHGEFILFTDADVLFRPEALRRAVTLAHDRRADHLVVGPGIILKGFWERLMVGYFGVMFSLSCRTWEVEDSRKPDAFIGVGAFNMVRRSAYEAINGHERLRLEVADDLKLGKLLKQSGFRQVFARAGDQVIVRWVDGLAGFVNGLTKNFFAALEFRWGAVIGITLFTAATHIAPAPGAFWGTRISRLAFAGALIAMPAAINPPRWRPTARHAPLSPEHQALEDAWIRTAKTPWPLFGPLFPLAAVIWLYTMWRSAILTQLRGGIEWRGTFYPLSELKQGIRS